MAPSTSTPTDLRRAPVACLQCRKAKVRCLVSTQLDRCDRCRTNDAECVFTRPKRARARVQPYPLQRQECDKRNGHNYRQTGISEDIAVGDHAVLQQSGSDGPSPIQPPFPSTGLTTNFEDTRQSFSKDDQSVITNATRARIVKVLANIKSQRGSPFSFVTSGDSPSFSTNGDTNFDPPNQAQWQNQSVHSQAPPSSLKLSRLLRPLTNCPPPGSTDSLNEDDWRPTGSIKMPSYISSMALGQAMTDPIDGGVITPRTSNALFEFFMVQMNAKWEYILDPLTDTHDTIRKRNALLFASILFCSSKFASFNEDRNELLSSPDLYLQSRLCCLARNLVIKTLAEGDRSIETMQALYLLVCWKDADDDISYLHSGYAFRLLHDLDLGHGVCDGRQMARRKRMWLALFRQDRQQSLFFMRRSSLGHADDDFSSLGSIYSSLQTPYSLPLDFVGCCSGHIRSIQSRIRLMVQKSSVSMLPCLIEQMDIDLKSWRSEWSSNLEGEGRARAENQSSILPELLYPDRQHLEILIAVWENSVRLNISSAILRHALIATVTSSTNSADQQAHAPVNIDLSTIQEVLSPAYQVCSAAWRALSKHCVI
ncbi:uncharacterized protein N7469_004615 [Penicillium citrinum]|uniref:Zn(2)-C6 fungal-type domain-containing protein n=1 Tax=Penicillium citrinum TaxID=5077 RepID=A0A9W9TQY7_PENCI|nr:uncharacterized protein N7469_004615 [Penicillium citrinum]KAJ5235447.1 hypothetical protein N7469_004615 [Penicillium citrinum]